MFLIGASSQGLKTLPHQIFVNLSFGNVLCESNFVDPNRQCTKYKYLLLVVKHV